MIRKLLNGWHWRRGRFILRVMPLQWYFGIGVLAMISYGQTFVLALGPLQLYLESR